MITKSMYIKFKLWLQLLCNDERGSGSSLPDILYFERGHTRLPYVESGTYSFAIRGKWDILVCYTWKVGHTRLLV
jgi:hypothetical protein